LIATKTTTVKRFCQTKT